MGAVEAIEKQQTTKIEENEKPRESVATLSFSKLGCKIQPWQTHEVKDFWGGGGKCQKEVRGFSLPSGI